MKILHYTLGIAPYRSGGLTRYSWDLMKTQAKNQKNVVKLLFPGYMNGKKTDFRYFTNKENVEIYEMINPLPVPLMNGIMEVELYIKSISLEEKIKKFFQKEKFDVMHIHTLMGLPIEVVRIAKKAGCKIVFTTHDYFGICPKVNLLQYDGSVCNGNTEKCEICNKTAYSMKKIKIMQSKLYRKFKGTSAFKILQRHNKNELNKNEEHIGELKGKNKYDKLRKYYFEIFNLVDKVHFNSSKTKEIYSNIVGAEGEIVSITHSDIKDRRKVKKVGETINLVYLGDLQKYKGIELLIEALEMIPEKNWTLNIYGNKTKNNENTLEGKITYNGRYGMENLEEIFKKSDILIVPSICNETFGFTLLEGLSFGVPIITTNLVGASDLIKEDENGWIIEPEKNALKSLLQDIVNGKKNLEKVNEFICRDNFNFTILKHIEEIEKKIYR